MPPKPKVHVVTIQLTLDDYKKVKEEAKQCHQTVEEWIESMCHTATMD
jgi:hypothetical protein